MEPPGFVFRIVTSSFRMRFSICSFETSVPRRNTWLVRSWIDACSA